MTLLLDSHATLWWLIGSGLLPRRLAARIADPSNEVLVSAVTFYELHYKATRSRLPISSEILAKTLDASGLALLPILPRHAMEAALLDWQHRDPWDRILAAQTRLENCQLASRDSIFDELGIDRLW